MGWGGGGDSGLEEQAGGGGLGGRGGGPGGLGRGRGAAGGVGGGGGGPWAWIGATAAEGVGGLTASAQNLWTLSTSSQNAFARIFLKAAISGTTPAHNDYTDTLTFVASGTY